MSMPSTASKVPRRRVEPAAGRVTVGGAGRACRTRATLTGAGGGVDLGDVEELGDRAREPDQVTGGEGPRARRPAEDVDALGGGGVAVRVGVLLLDEEAVEHVGAGDEAGDDGLDDPDPADERLGAPGALDLGDPASARRRVHRDGHGAGRRSAGSRVGGELGGDLVGAGCGGAATVERGLPAGGDGLQGDAGDGGRRDGDRPMTPLSSVAETGADAPAWNGALSDAGGARPTGGRSTGSPPQGDSGVEAFSVEQVRPP